MREPWWWRGDDVAARAARGMLAPLGAAFRFGVALRNAAWDRGLRSASAAGLPTFSVGNISVGGTGKTPVTSWLATEVLRRRGRPGIVLRGYGEDEVEVHRVLAPSAIVVADHDRVRGAQRAREAGATAIVLDDAFQHRRIRRDFDLVLVSADVPWTSAVLPVGPLREPPSSLRRADLVLVTAKVASEAAIRERVAHARGAGARAVGVLHILADRLCDARGELGPVDLAALAGAKVLAVSGIADPAPFHAALGQQGGRVVAATYADHARFGPAEIAALAQRARDVDFVVCTLKDAVKLRTGWPHSALPLWYVSQRIEPAGGTDMLQSALDEACGPPDTPETNLLRP